MPLGHPQRLWRRLFHGRRGRWHLVWHQGRQKLSPRRTPHWRRLLHQSQSPRDRRKLWRLGWHVLNFRLCNQGLAAERGCLECHSFGVYDRWLFGCTKRPQIRTWLSHCLRYSSRRLRRCRCPRFARIQRRQQTTNGTTTSRNDTAAACIGLTGTLIYLFSVMHLCPPPRPLTKSVVRPCYMDPSMHMIQNWHLILTMYITVTSHSLPHSTCSPGLDRHVTYRLNTSPIHYSFFISKPTSRYSASTSFINCTHFFFRVPNIVAERVLLIDSPPTH